jgi:hypothetical protein
VKINTVSVNYDRKFNLGNYESVQIGVQIWASVEDEEDTDGVIQFMFDEAKQHVKKNVPSNYRPFAKTVKKTETVSGIEVEE